MERLIASKGVGATEQIALKLAELRVENMELRQRAESMEKCYAQSVEVGNELRHLVSMKQFS